MKGHKKLSPQCRATHHGARLLRSSDGKRVPAAEIMLKSPYISDLIEKRDIDMLKEAIAQGRELGMQTFDQALYDLVKAGPIIEEVALDAADSRNSLRLRLERGAGAEEASGLQSKEIDKGKFLS